MSQITIRYKFELHPNMGITALTIEGTTVYEPTLSRQRTGDTIEGEVSVWIISDVITVQVLGVGRSYTAGKFNLAYGGNNVFKESQNLPVKYNGQINFIKRNVKLP